MSIAQAIKEKVVEPHDRQRFDLITGQVMSYDEETNTATICYKDSKTGGLMTQERVPVELSGLGIIASGPFPGDQVYLSFVNGNQLKPKVVAKTDEAYANYTRPLTKHGRKGAFLTDYLSNVSSFIGGLFKGEENTAIQDDWIDDSSSSVTYKGYQQYSTDDFTAKGENWAYYRTAEVGFTHPLNSSTMKIRDNGVIESFASTNCGIRIDPNSHSLNLISSKELHNATNATFLVDRQLRFEVGRQLYLKTPATSINAEKQQIKSDSILIQTDRYALTGETVKLTADDWNVVTKQANLSLGKAEIEASSFDLKADITKMLSEEIKLSAHQTQFDSDTTIYNTSHYQLNADNVDIVGHIEADIDHLIERWMKKHFDGYIDRALGERQIVKLLQK